MPSYRQSILLLALSALPGAVQSADRISPLHINPFVQPETVAGGVGSAVPAAAESMVLRAVILAGEHSLANIGGKIVGIGQDINGYRLIVVNERNVVLDRDGVRRELGIKTQDGVGNNE